MNTYDPKYQDSFTISQAGDDKVLIPKTKFSVSECNALLLQVIYYNSADINSPKNYDGPGFARFCVERGRISFDTYSCNSVQKYVKVIFD